MGFKTNSGSPSRSPVSDINVTPLVDVMLVLLIMFMVTAPLIQQGIDVDLPETNASGVEASDEPFMIVVHKNAKITAGKEPIKLAELKNKLKAIFAIRKNKQVYIQADKSVEYGIVAEAMAEIRAAGIYNIGLITLPKTNP